MKSLKDILNGAHEEYSDKDLETSIFEAVEGGDQPEVTNPAEADKVTAAMANLSDMVTMADEIYYTLSDLEEIEEEMVEKIESIFTSLDDLYKEVDETYDIAVPEMGPTEIDEAEEIIGQSLDSILNETYEMAGPKTREQVLTAMKRELRGMKVNDLKASYQYIKAAYCNTKEGMQGMGTKKDMMMAMYKDLQAMKKHDLMASYQYIKASNCTSEKREVAFDLEEMKTKDDDLAVMIYDYIGADTEGLPLKTLIHQAVGKYFGSQKDKKNVKGVTEATSQTVKNQKSLDAGSELMRVVNSIDTYQLDGLWDFKIIDKKDPVDVKGSRFPLYKSATLKIFKVKGEDPFTSQEKKYLLDLHKKAQKGAGSGVGRKWDKMEFSRDGMEAISKITV